MGRTFLFECPKCQYRARVSGGADRGLNVAVQTIQCLDCKDLYDAVVSIRYPTPPSANIQRPNPIAGRKVPARPPRFETAAGLLTVGVAQRVTWTHYPPACPVSHLHRIKEWLKPGKCPRCGVFLEANGLAFRLWD